MGLAHRKLERYKHLYDRFSEILKFETFGVNDLSQIFNQLSEIQFTADYNLTDKFERGYVGIISVLFRFKPFPSI